MEHWKTNARREAVITDLDTLVPKDHLLRKIEAIMDYDCYIVTTTDDRERILWF